MGGWGFERIRFGGGFEGEKRVSFVKSITVKVHGRSEGILRKERF